jgi:hypothetical protein
MEATEDNDDKEEMRKHILSIEGQVDSDNEKGSDKKESGDFTEDDETSERGAAPVERLEQIAAETKKDMKDFQGILDRIQQKESVKE